MQTKQWKSRQSDLQAMNALRGYSITVIIETKFYYLRDLHPSIDSIKTFFFEFVLS